MKVKVMMCMEKRIVRGYEVELDTKDHPKLQELIDNGELPDLSRGGKYPDGGRYWRCEDTGIDIHEFTEEVIGDEDWYEHFHIVEGTWNDTGIVWECDDEPKEIVGYIPQEEGEDE